VPRKHGVLFEFKAFPVQNPSHKWALLWDQASTSD